MKEIIVIGAGGHSRSVISTILACNDWNIVGVYDNSYKEPGEKVLGFEIKGLIEDSYSLKIKNVVVAIGDNYKRGEIIQKYIDLGFNLPNIIHPTVQLSPEINLGKGNFISALSYIGPNVTIGSGNIINSACVVEHDCLIGDNNHLAPSSSFSGNVEIKNNVFIGVGATVINNIQITSDIIVGAGSVIIRDFTIPGKKIVGVPGKYINS